MKYAITGASGTLGRLTTEALLARVDASDVVLITRDPSKLDGNGAEVRAGDFSAPETLDFSGIDRLLLISTDAVGERVAGHKAAIAAAVAAGVQRIAYTSIPNPSHNNPAFVVPDHRETELALIASGAHWTFLRNAIYTEMYLASAPGAIASGTLVTNVGDGLAVNVSRQDCAEAAAAVLVGDEHDDKAYDITGTEPISADGLAALYSELSGKPVSVQNLDDDAWVQAMSAHLPEAAARAFASFGEATRRGYAAVVSTAVADLTGHAPRSLREVLAPGLSG
ncbi:SDR family oxidoreductase [Solirubrobacter soli]|uniref:SDR family oxidoreductase n=1 Tax=Solirubrobacter soli TaxID=363832 RepID=UPI00040A80F8|nr:SDR family oxidoreductase [Solirubrobacter soli]